MDWFNDTWENTARDSYTYDANNNKTTYLYQIWFDTEWMDFMKSIYTYDANNHITDELSQIRNDTTWEDDTKKMYSYDARYNMISETVEDWNGAGWDNSERSTYTYDANNNETSFLVQFWNGGNWQNVFQSRHAFDENNLMIYGVSVGWDMEKNTIESSDSTRVYYHEVATSIPALSEANISVYPNPAKGMLTINSSRSITTIEVYNLSGKRIYSDFDVKQQTSKEIDLSGCSKGIYILKIYTGTKSYNRKVVVQ